MAGKAKSCYLTVYNRDTKKTVLNKMFFNMAALNEFCAAESFQETYPAANFTLFKETY